MKKMVFCMVKPDGLPHVSFIVEHLSSVGINIVYSWRVMLTVGDVRMLYPSLIGRTDGMFELTCKSLVGHQVLMMVGIGDQPFDRLRAAKEYLRSRLATDNPKGILHTSEDHEETIGEMRYFLNAKRVH